MKLFGSFLVGISVLSLASLNAQAKNSDAEGTSAVYARSYPSQPAVVLIEGAAGTYIFDELLKSVVANKDGDKVLPNLKCFASKSCRIEVNATGVVNIK